MIYDLSLNQLFQGNLISYLYSITSQQILLHSIRRIWIIYLNALRIKVLIIQDLYIQLFFFTFHKLAHRIKDKIAAPIQKYRIEEKSYMAMPSIIVLLSPINCPLIIS